MRDTPQQIVDVMRLTVSPGNTLYVAVKDAGPTYTSQPLEMDQWSSEAGGLGGEINNFPLYLRRRMRGHVSNPVTL